MATPNLLLHFNNSLADSGSGSHTVTPSGAGATLSSTEFKFGGFSEHLDGTAYLTILNYNGDFTWPTDFTIDCWVNTTSTTLDGSFNRILWCIAPNSASGLAVGIQPDGKIIVAINSTLYITGTTSCNDGLQHHIALTRQGTNLRLFIDGIQEGTTYTLSGTITGADLTIGINTGVSGGHWDGYVDEFRVIKGLAKWTSDFTPRIVEYETPEVADFLAHYDTDFNDVIIGLVPTATNGTYISIDTGTKKFGAGSVYFNPPNSSTDVKLTYAQNTVFDWPTDFTIDCWVKWEAGNFSSTYKTIWSNGNWTTGGIALMQINADGRFVVLYNGNFQNLSTTTTHDGNFHHVAVTRLGSTVRLFVDGIEEGTGEAWTNAFIGGSFFLSHSPFSPNVSYFPWTGWIDELRILNSEAQWTSNFTPESQEYLSNSIEQNILSDTKVVLTFDEDILSDTRISPVHFITSDVNIKATVTQTIDSDAKIVITLTNNILSDAKIRAKKDIVSNTNIRVLVTEDILSNTKIIRQVSEDISSDTIVVNKHTGDIFSDTVISQRVLKTLTAETIIITPLDLVCQLDYLQNKISDKHFEVEVIQIIPGIPFNVTLQNVGNGDSLRIEWDGTAPYFNVYRVDIGPTYVKINPFLITDHFYVIGGLQENVTYTFIVRGADGRG